LLVKFAQPLQTIHNVIIYVLYINASIITKFIINYSIRNYKHLIMIKYKDSYFGIKIVNG